MSRVRSLAALACCLVVVAVLGGLRATGLAEARSYPAGQDGWAHAPAASGRVLSARLARNVLRPRVSAPLATTHVFVVIELAVQVRERSLPFSTVQLRTPDGVVYSQLNDAGIDSLTLTKPGFTIRANAVFELPPARVAGATLIVGAQSDLLVIYRAQLAFPDVAGDQPVLEQIRLSSSSTTVTR